MSAFIIFNTNICIKFNMLKKYREHGHTNPQLKSLGVKILGYLHLFLRQD